MDPQPFDPGLAEALPNPVFVVRRDGTLRYANCSGRAYHGIAADIADRSFIASLEPAAAGELTVLLSSREEPFSFECRLRRGDGEFRWHFTQISPLDIESGETEWLVSAFDVDKRVRETEEMRLTDERYRVIFESMDQGFCVIEMLFDAAGVAYDFAILETNPAFEEIAGFSGKCDSIRVLLPDLEEHWFERYGTVAITGKPVRFVDQVSAMDGRWFEASAFRLGDAQSKTIAVLFTDYTVRQRASEDEARLAAIVESSRDAIHGRTLDGIVTAWNHGAEELYGYTESEMVGSHVSVLFPPGRDVELSEISEQLKRGERVPPFETVRMRKDGTLVDVELTLSPIADPSGHIVGVAAISRNVSERQAAQRQQQALLEAISHDLKNPLTTITAHAQLLRRRLDRGVAPDVASLTRTVDAIQVAAQRLNTQLGELQDVVQLRAGEPLDLRTATTDLVSLVVTAAADAQLTTTEHTVSVTTESQLLAGEWDALRLRRVMDNLLDNAIKYSPNGGQIVIEIAEQRDDKHHWAVVTVSDEGVGIPEADLPHIFERYRRGSNVGNRTVGAGIGLAGARQIVQQHGGTLEVESAEHVGSTFTIRLPLDPASQTQEPGDSSGS